MGNHQTILSRSAEETSLFGHQMALRVKDDLQHSTSLIPHIFCLYGELGSGKTTFTQGFAKGLGIESRIVSPTFIISKRYSLPIENKFFYHLDIYRISKESELKDLGISEIFSDSQSCAIIEWADKMGTLLPPRRYDIIFQSQADQSHEIQVTRYD